MSGSGEHRLALAGEVPAPSFVATYIRPEDKQIGMPWAPIILRPLDVVWATSRSLRVPYEDLVGRMRHRSLAEARRVGMYVARKLTKASFTEIGKAFERDHTTIMEGCRRVEEQLPKEPIIGQMVWAVELELRKVTSP